MAKPSTNLTSSSDIASVALEIVNGARFPHLATVDSDQPQTLPVNPVWKRKFAVYLANLKSYPFSVSIPRSNHKVGLSFQDEDHRVVQISSVVEHVKEPEELDLIWNNYPLLGQHVGTVLDDRLLIYRLRPIQVRLIVPFRDVEYDVLPADID